MGRPLRIIDSETIFFVTNRCLEGRFFFQPTEKVNAQILGWLGRSADMFGVELFAFIFMGNHLHLLVRCPRENLHLFMAYLQGNLSRSLNQLRGRRGTIFGRRYSAEPVLDEESLLDRYLYIATNPLTAGLTMPWKWPGVSSFMAETDGERLVGRWLDRQSLAQLRRRHPEATEAQATLSYPIDITPLPQHEGLTAHQRVDVLSAAVKARVQQTMSARWSDGKTRLAGPEAVLAMGPDDRPASAPCTPRPLCHTRCRHKRAAYAEKVRTITSDYREAVSRWRKGQSRVAFPTGTIPPAWRRIAKAGDVGPTRCLRT